MREKKEKETNLQKAPLQNIATIMKLEIDSYSELIQSLPAKLRKDIINELDTRLIVQRAELLCKELSENAMVGLNLEESRTLFLAALRNLRDKKISVNQLATLHILDSAIRTLNVSPMIYFIYQYVNGDGHLARTINAFTLTTLKGMPTSVKRYPYNALVLPKEGISASDMPWRMQKPLMQRFFNFNELEWDQFCEEMTKISLTEQFFLYINCS
ncbi:Uncharacterised protein [Legionella busanensis]|uniref:Uncharacterized protein n=1 Tax=Legionella busanensis TaxID=190655 RepID=A0A378JNT1_9GAMM|nr:hypothetical protein [Legionella busanensis]STX52338.1 Uncharacterised protein [Legionella busanensis]